MKLKLPYWLTARIVRRNPWLLGDDTKMTRSREITLLGGLIRIGGGAEMALSREEREKLLRRYPDLRPPEG